MKLLKQFAAWLVLRKIVEKTEAGDWIGALDAAGMMNGEFDDMTLQEAHEIFEVRVNGYVNDLMGRKVEE